MKRVFLLVAAISSLIFFTFVTADATVYTFKPYDNIDTKTTDIMDLDHTKYYDWRILWNIPPGETITGIDLTFYDIYNWQHETNDKLFLHILDNDTTPGLSHFATKDYWTPSMLYSTTLYYGTDNQNGGDYWAGNPLIIDPFWTDLDDNAGIDNVLTFNVLLTNEILSMIMDGNFGIGLDPECHYYNNGVKLKIYTTCNTVPEPGTLLLLGSGLLGAVFFARRRKQ